jgi:hypothetical protein
MDPYQHPEDEDRDALRSVSSFTVQPLDPADSPQNFTIIKTFSGFEVSPMYS